MELGPLLNVIRSQRHDFLNHLQVVSGLIQMNRAAQAREYIQGLNREFELWGRIMHLQLPEAAAVLLVALHEAAQHQITVDNQIECTLSGCTVPGEITGRLLDGAMRQAIDLLAPPEVTNRRLAVHLSELTEHYSCRLVFTPPVGMDGRPAQERLAKINERLAAFGGEAGMSITPEEAEIFLNLPRRSEREQTGT
ncbi:Spo0B domain-containing protein [Desulfotomaculum copahuensis]|uniref:SpoOB alpha-helical domain-containing protein n=1 Tax=Desulfotomaculum copahuensis TaxID=1838280 RepID=A0A1B7LHB9_9FIRM|nr:Spo0B domain-containing protein [Desulfotomaculum copahuensis]OAT85579.1 hypothetical protein A6M21_05520 [Desulfotomaculum copahuensis]